MKEKLNNIDNYIKHIYKNSDIPNNILDKAFDNLENSKKNNKTIYIKYIASFSIIIFILATGISIFIKTSNSTKQQDINQNDDNNSIQIDHNNYATENEIPVASYTIDLDSSSGTSNKFISPMGLDLLKENSDCIAVIKLNKILYYTNYCQKLDFYSTTVLTVSNVHIHKLYKGSLNGELEIMSLGGIVSISDFEKGCQPEQVKKLGFDKMSSEEKENTYIKVKDTLSSKLPPLEEEKYYLVYLKYNERFDKYQVLDQFIYEYDITNDTIKNIDTNEWSSFVYN